MKVNKALMAAARAEKKLISDLTVKEFKKLMQQCFDADRAATSARKVAEQELEWKLINGFSTSNGYMTYTKAR